MSDLNETPSANRVHISFFGCRNAGKSSVVNAVTGQKLSIVSATKGTTTDPVTKAMELLPLGPVVIIDTPGIDDTGELGEMRVQKAKQILRKTDVAILVVDGTVGLTEPDQQLLRLFQGMGLSWLTVWNKVDLLQELTSLPSGDHDLWVSALRGDGIHELKERIGSLAHSEKPAPRMIGDLVPPGGTAVLVCPIDESAPKGRMILPQQQAIRDVLDSGALALVVRETELDTALSQLGGKADLVVTDSQAFELVARVTPEEIPLTSFSILMANVKGYLQTAVAGVSALKNLQDGDTVLVAEACTHHRQCNDIGTVKLPGWLRRCTGKDLQFAACSGREFPEDLSPYAMVVHCGGCMITPREVQSRMRIAQEQGVPFTNYGITIAQVTGQLERSLRVFPDIHALL